MSHHKGVACFQILELVAFQPRHLVDHRTFQVNHFIVGKYKDILLVFIVAHRKGHPIVVVLAEIRIQLHVVEEVMHPAHVPLVGEVQSVFLRCSGHARPCR